jgi:hypothetical protein
MSDTRRITLVIRGAGIQSRPWDASSTAANRILFVKALSMLGFVLDHSEDVERVVVEESASSEDFLDVLATLPREFLGDVLLVRSGRNSYLSTVGRAEGRLLYALNAADLQFYMETHRLVAAEAKAA